MMLRRGYKPGGVDVYDSTPEKTNARAFFGNKNVD